MNKITGISLNGNAFQLEDQGFSALAAYLAQAKERLAGNPDLKEIMADLEQAIADKFQRFLSSQKSVVSTEEVATVIREMGPVDGEEQERSEEPVAGPKRLYRIQEGAIIGGVSTGVAAYLNIDVVIVRLLFVLFTIVTTGGFIFGYILGIVFIPLARTKEQQAAASGSPFNAEELIARAKTEYAKLDKKHSQWRRERKKRRDEERRFAREHIWVHRYRHHPAGVLGQLIGAVVFSFLAWYGFHTYPVVHDFFTAVWDLVLRVSDQIAQFIIEQDA
jgi:phage shock protein PspC (stress-responsive transcriptional regulator)